MCLAQCLPTAILTMKEAGCKSNHIIPVLIDERLGSRKKSHEMIEEIPEQSEGAA